MAISPLTFQQTSNLNLASEGLTTANSTVLKGGFKPTNKVKEGTSIRGYTEGLLRLMSSQTYKVPTQVIQ